MSDGPASQPRIALGGGPTALLPAGVAVLAGACAWLLPGFAQPAATVAALAAVLAAAGWRRRVEQAPMPVAEHPLGDRLFNLAPVGILRLDAQRRILAANPALLGMVQPSDGVVGRPVAEMVVAEERDALNGMLKAAMASEAGPQRLEATLVGTPSRIVALHAGRLPTAGAGAEPELLLHVVDVTSFKELENQVVQARKMQAVGQLAGGIAHDFNNLLTAMIGFCDLLLLRHRAGDQSFADIMQIKQNANRAASLVRQLLAFSRQQTLRPKILDITDTLAELSHLLRRLIGQTVVLKIIHGRDLGLVRVDQSQFEQVIINLAVNARDAMPTGGALTVRTANAVIAEPVVVAHETMPPGDYVRVDVADTGVGIPKELQTRIFEPFFTTKPVGMGTGLGLSTVYGIVRQTGGFVLVESESGEGTTFSIYLPRHAGTDRAEERGGDDAERTETDLTGSGTILLVEDEDPVRLFTARALRNKGYKVLEAKSGEAALELLSGLTERLDLMITDAVMPVIDGPSLIRMVREQRPDLRVICISGHTDEHLRNRIATTGDVLFLPKPFSLKQLAARVKEVMAGEGPRPA